jgi:hypothetical protein
VVPQVDGVPMWEHQFSLVDIRQAHFTLSMSSLLNISGLKLHVEELPMLLVLNQDQAGGLMRLAMASVPKKVVVDGALYGFLPVWAIDLVIPSNLEELTRNFVEVMATGKNGEGMSMQLVAPRDAKPQRVCADAKVRLMSNGLIKLGMDLQAKLGFRDEKVQQDFHKFVANSTLAFEQDLAVSPLRP